MARTFAEILKDSPTVGDVHIRGGKARRVPRSRTRAKDNAEKDLNKGATVGVFKAVEVLPDKQMIFGWASVVTKDGKLIVDKQGDIIEPQVLEDAAYDYVLEARDHGHMHQTIGTGRLVESMVFTAEKQKALGIDLGFEGWFTGFKVAAPEVWDAYRRGELPEFSIGGLAVSEEYDG
jgi:hypothetical protein